MSAAMKPMLEAGLGRRLLWARLDAYVGVLDNYTAQEREAS
jgi:hypothetical protein